MSATQRFLMALLPRRWHASIQRDSQAWKMRCTTCGYTRSIWDAGGIRWKAVSVGKRMYLKCLQCDCLRVMAIEFLPDQPTAHGASPSSRDDGHGHA